MGRHQVSIITDWTVALPSFHASVHVPPPPPPTACYPHAECPVMLAHLPGLSSHKFTSNVFHQGHQIAKDGHDCGKGIPHLTAPLHSVLLPLHTIFSKRKTMFGASTVRANGVALGIIDISGLCPMLMCAAPLSLPAQWAPTNIANTVYVGSTSGDFWGGWAGIAVNAMIEAIIFRAAKAVAHVISPEGDHAIELVVKYLTKLHLKLLLPYDKPSKWVKKRVQEVVDSDSSPPPITPTKDPAVVRTSSPFGDATISVTAQDDGAFLVETSSPTAAGARRTTRYEGLRLAELGDQYPTAEPPSPEALFRGAPQL